MNCVKKYSLVTFCLLVTLYGAPMYCMEASMTDSDEEASMTDSDEETDMTDAEETGDEKKEMTDSDEEAGMRVDGPLVLVFNQSKSHRTTEPDKDDIFAAVKAGNVARVKQFIDNGVDVNQHDTTIAKNTPLIDAAAKGYVEIVTLLINNGADIARRDVTGNTPLHSAAEKGHIKVINVLITVSKADVNTINNFGMTPLHNAASQGKTAAVQALIDAHALLDSQDDDGNTALHLAVEEDHTDVAEALLAAGAKTDIQNADGQIPSQLLEADDSETTIALLLEEYAARTAQTRQPTDAEMVKESAIPTDIPIRHTQDKDNPFANLFVNTSNPHMLDSIMKNLSLQDLAGLRKSCTEIRACQPLKDEIEARRLIQNHHDPLRFLEHENDHRPAIYNRLIQLGADMARIGTESTDGQYQVLKDRPKIQGLSTGEQLLDTCQCHFIEPSSQDSNDSIIAKIDLLSRCNPGDTFFLMLSPDSAKQQERLIDPEFIQQLSQYPIIGLYFSDVTFNDGNGGALIIPLLGKFPHLRELIIINPKNLVLKTQETTDGQQFINNGSIFHSISKLIELRALILQKAGLIEVTDEIGNLKKLRYLDLSHNDTELISPAIASLTKLETLNIVGNNLNELPLSMQEMTRLRNLRLARNSLTFKTIRDIASYLPNLRLLDIQTTPELRALPEAIGNLKKLKILNVSDTLIAKLPVSLGDMKKLKKLNTTFTLISVLPEILGMLPNLCELHLSAKITMSWDLLKKLCEHENFKIFFDDLDEAFKTWPVQNLKAALATHMLLIEVRNGAQYSRKQIRATREKLPEVLRGLAKKYDYMAKDCVSGYDLNHSRMDPDQYDHDMKILKCADEAGHRRTSPTHPRSWQ